MLINFTWVLTTLLSNCIPKFILKVVKRNVVVYVGNESLFINTCTCFCVSEKIMAKFTVLDWLWKEHLFKNYTAAAKWAAAMANNTNQRELRNLYGREKFSAQLLLGAGGGELVIPFFLSVDIVSSCKVVSRGVNFSHVLGMENQWWGCERW